MAIFQSLHFLLLANIATFTQASVLRPRVLRARDTTYSSNVRDPSLLGSFGFPGQTATVDAGVTYFISGQGPHGVLGNIVNSGSIVVSQTDSLLGVGGLISTPLSVTYAGAGTVGIGGIITDGVVVTNPGSLISLNDYGDTSLVSTTLYNWALYSMVNGGTMQWCGNGGPPTGSTFTLTCSTNTCINNGLISWEQYNADNGVLFTWTALVNPINNGAFRLINTDLQITQDVLSTVSGGGCFVLGNNGLLSLQAGTQGLTVGTKTFATQSIYFTANTAGLYITPAVYLLNKNFGATLYGFGRGNYIAFTEPLAILNPLTGTVPYSYSGSTLTVNFLSGTSILINIGTGYSSGLFSTILVPDLLRLPLAVIGIVYNGATPSQTPPSVCSVSYPVCANPAVTVTASFASTVGTTATATPQYVTVTSTSAGITGTATTTLATASGSSTGTVEVIVPATYVTATVTSGTAAVYTTTIPPSGTAPGTVEVIVPAAYVTAIVTSGTAAVYTTIIPPSGTAPGTVEVVVPAVYVTATVTSGTAAAYTTIIPPSGTAPGTVLVVDPGTFVTVTANSIGATAGSTYTVQPSGTAPGTVIIVQPTNTNYVSVTNTYSGTGTSTTILAAPSGTSPGTVEVLIPTNASRPAVLNTTIGPNQCVCRPRPTS